MKVVGGFYRNSRLAETGALSVKLAVARAFSPQRVFMLKDWYSSPGEFLTCRGECYWVVNMKLAVARVSSP